MSDLNVTIETPKDHKVRNFIKKHTPTKSQLKTAALGAGAGILAGAAVVAFAFKRLDEEDFETEFELDEPSEEDDVIVIHEN